MISSTSAREERRDRRSSGGHGVALFRSVLSLKSAAFSPLLDTLDTGKRRTLNARSLAVDASYIRRIMSTTKTLSVRIFQHLVPYARAQQLQHAIHCARKNAFVPDTLLILQHPPVVTVGKRSEVGLKSIKTSEEKLRELKCDVIKSDRGGDVTYHGPGQVVVYPVIHLREQKLGARKYVEKLENVMIEVAKKYGITNARGQMKNEEDGSDMSGVWVGKKKLGAVGVKISGGVTSHGFALNSETDLEFFREHILPCGLKGMDVTSLKDLVGEEVKMERVEVEIVDAFAKEYGYTEVYTRRC